MSERGAVLTGRLATLTLALRAEGARAGVGELLAAHRALGAVDPSSRNEARLALRVALCSSHDDLERFDRAFLAVFGDGRGPAGTTALDELGEIGRAALPHVGVPAEGPPPPGVSTEQKPVPAAFSQLELIRHKDFARLSEQERVAAQRLIRRLARHGAQRRSRRTCSTTRRTRTPDLRSTTHAAMRTLGEPVVRRYRAPTEKLRPLVLILDVSGSMSPYARMLMTYLQAAVAVRRRVEAFAFGTRLTRITQELRGRDPDAALERAAQTVSDFAGGTRIGDALAELNRAHGRRVGRGAIVIVLSDGWDRGDPQQLAAEMARLRRTAHRLIWLNPLAAEPDYEPLTRGMVAAVPHTDALLAGNSIASLQELADLLEAL